VPQPDSADDTSYFISRFTQISGGMLYDRKCSNSDSDTQESSSNSGAEVDILHFISHISCLCFQLKCKFYKLY
jgi:hypothetical protein